jgi:hypothetical protein
MLSAAQIGEVRRVVMGMDSYLRHQLMPTIQASTHFEVMRDCPEIVEGVRQLQSLNVLYTDSQRAALDGMTTLLQTGVNTLLDAIRGVIATRLSDGQAFDEASALVRVNGKHRELCDAFAQGAGKFVSTLSSISSDGSIPARDRQPMSVFLSYRRSDTQALVDRLFKELKPRFTDVFRDLDSIQGGDPFAQKIQARLNTTDVVVVVIGKSWLAKPFFGRPRLFERGDLVRAEVEAGLASNARVVPLLCDNAAMPKKEALPRTISALCDLSALNLRLDPDFGGDVERLVRHLARPPERTPLPL